VTGQQGQPGPLISSRGLGVVYGSGEAAVRALDGIELEVRPNETLALLGRSGSGKTTLLHALGGLVEPTVGEIRRHQSRLGRTSSGFVFQGANLLPHFTSLENIAFAAHVRGDGAAQRPTATALLELVGLAAKADHLPSELSGGEAQRVATARALVQEPQLLLCDEPTGHLDSATGERMLDLLEALQRKFGFALVVATHDADVAARMQRALELHDGRIVAEVPSA
jgi:putative ABC transport system ATP-binding protein